MPIELSVLEIGEIREDRIFEIYNSSGGIIFCVSLRGSRVKLVGITGVISVCSRYRPDTEKFIN